MKCWKSLPVYDAPVGAICLVAICITAMCFPLVRVLDGLRVPFPTVLLVICGFTFTPAVTCSVYSVARENSKLFGAAGLVIAPITVMLQRETLYFVEMGLLLVPCTLVVMMVVAKRRARQREQQAQG